MLQKMSIEFNQEFSQHCQHENADKIERVHHLNRRRKSISKFYDYIIERFYYTSIQYFSPNFPPYTLQINQYVAVSRNAFMVWHVMRLQKFYVKLMLTLRPIHSNGRLTIRQKHLKCRRVITEHIHHEHHRSPTRQ
jgi:hypothetical protein